jgi:arginine decarboxylase
MSGAKPVYVRPEYDAERELTHSITSEALRASLDAHPEAKAAMVFTPTYYGTSADVSALAEACRERGLPLVTDDARGLDYSFTEQLPPSALSCGSDLAIGSVHKSLTASQTPRSARATRTTPPMSPATGSKR